MEKIITFPLDDKIEYCSVRMNNNILTSNIGSRSDVSIEEGVLYKLIDSFDKNINYIVDFLDCIGTINTTDKILKEFARDNIIVLAPEKLKDAFLKQSQYEYEKYGNETQNHYLIIFNKEGKLYAYMNSIIQQVQGRDSAHFFQRLLLTRFFYYDIRDNPQYSFAKGELKYLESSNVYVNRYINVKSLFLNYNYMLLVIKGLKDLIKKEFKSNLSDITLLGVSNNGIILANLLSYELQISVQSLNRLGPVYCLKKEADNNGHFNNNKYVLISDVICMGGEYKMAKSIVDALGSELLGGVCVVKIRDIYRNRSGDNIHALLDNINELEVDNKKIDYQIFIDDLELGGNTNE